MWDFRQIIAIEELTFEDVRDDTPRYRQLNLRWQELQMRTPGLRTMFLFPSADLSAVLPKEMPL